MDDVSASRAPQRSIRMEVTKTCKACGKMGKSKAYMTILPHVHNEVFQVEFKCSKCAYADNDIKREGFSSVGRSFSLSVRSEADLQRFLLHAPSAQVDIGVMELSFEGGATAGTFLTVAQLIDGIAEDLKSHANVISSDLDGAESRRALFAFLDEFHNLKKPKSMPWTLAFRDPLNMSYIGSTSASLDDDEGLTIADFERTFDEEERHHVEPDLIDPNTLLRCDMDTLTLAAEPDDALAQDTTETIDGVAVSAEQPPDEGDDDDMPPLVDEDHC